MFRTRRQAAYVWKERAGKPPVERFVRADTESPEACPFLSDADGGRGVKSEMPANRGPNFLRFFPNRAARPLDVAQEWAAVDHRANREGSRIEKERGLVGAVGVAQRGRFLRRPRRFVAKNPMLCTAGVHTWPSLA